MRTDWIRSRGKAGCYVMMDRRKRCAEERGKRVVEVEANPLSSQSIAEVRRLFHSLQSLCYLAFTIRSAYCGSGNGIRASRPGILIWKYSEVGQ